MSVRIRPVDVWRVQQYLKQEGCNPRFDFPVDFSIAVRLEITSDFSLRPYQQAALEACLGANHCRIVVLPTGARKSLLGLFAIGTLNQRALVVTPTLELMNQWHQRIAETFKSGEVVGRFGGGYKDLAPITVITYSSGCLHQAQFRAQFGLLVFDEVHHLAG